MKKNDLHQTIEAYVLHRMDGSTHMVFEQQIREDPDLAQQVQLHRQLSQVIEWQGLFDEAEQAIVQNRHRPIPFFRNIRLLYSIAASLLLLVAVLPLWWANTHYTHAKMLEAAVPVDRFLDNPVSLRSASTSDQESIITAVQTKDYQTIIQHLKPLVDEKGPLQKGGLSLAAAYYLQQNYEESIRLTEIIRKNSPDHGRRQKAEWLEIAAKAQLSPESDEWKIQLQSITASPQHRYHKQAGEWLRKLNSPWQKLVWKQ